MKIVVIGGTGLIGSKVVAILREHGRQAVAASPSTGVDALTGEGLAEALAGAYVVVDVSKPPSFDHASARAFFETSTRNLLAAEEQAGVTLHVALSIVGTGRWPENGWYQAKAAQERLIEQSSMPYSIVQATQFYEFVPEIAAAATYDDTVRMPPVFFQPIAGDEVAELVGNVAMGSPLNTKVEIAGPELFRMDEFFRDALAPREVITDPHGRYFGAEPGEETLVPGVGAIFGMIRYRDWAGDRSARSTTGGFYSGA
ncbi:LysR family transcriptional regulator [Acrocarpospora phusangensis]|uniref:LysR family transcriptional regulator n=1 Tax=Acrocarpospora phusangensis TaxID=1070424 RepID=A0A919QB19_9ACTN|nr:SDR family oxidoreductase [Acrocarpospora phusangensis]GIH25859.1 LysR family transcriptional regulator [Acrocarpospora phusangensis]